MIFCGFTGTVTHSWSTNQSVSIDLVIIYINMQFKVYINTVNHSGSAFDLLVSSKPSLHKVFQKTKVLENKNITLSNIRWLVWQVLSSSSHDIAWQDCHLHNNVAKLPTDTHNISLSACHWSPNHRLGGFHL